jgi:hypothetical protein
MELASRGLSLNMSESNFIIIVVIINLINIINTINNINIIIISLFSIFCDGKPSQNFKCQ